MPRKMMFFHKRMEDPKGVSQIDQGHVDPKEFEKEPVIVDAKGEEIHIEDKPAEDRSAFNCPDCSGEGLISQDKVCASCDGTGKTKNKFSGMPKGTVVLTKTGQFTIGEHGEMIKKEA